MRQNLVHFSNKVARRVQKAADVWAKQYWHDLPFGQEPKAEQSRYLQLWEEAKNVSYPDIDAFEKKKGFALAPDWFHELALHTQIVVKESALCYQHGRVLYTALRDYVRTHTDACEKASVPDGHRTVTILETGTARGFSAVCMAKALSDEGVSGKIVTFDLLPHKVQMYWNCIDDHEGMKTRQQLLAPWSELVDPYVIFIENDSRIGIRRAAMGRVHFAFLDGAHTYEDIMIEFDMVQQMQQPGDIVVFDDYNPLLFPGIIQGVDEGCDKWGYSKEIFGDNNGRAYVIAKKQG